MSTSRGSVFVHVIHSSPYRMGKRVHGLREGKFGLFENRMTLCGAAGEIEKPLFGAQQLVHYQTRARFDIATVFAHITCRGCLKEWYRVN